MPFEDAATRALTWVSGSTDADWDGLYVAQLPRVYNFFRYRVGCAADAEDLTSATFEKAWRGRRRYRRDLGTFTTWLLTIARRVAIDYLRRQYEQVSIESLPDAPSAARTPEQDVERQSDADRLAVLLSRLPAREREIVALKYGAEMTNRDIAAVLGLSESNVGTILHRTVQVLRAEWQ